MAINTSSSLVDAMTAEVMAAEYEMLLGAQGDFLQHPALIYKQCPAGSTTLKIPYLGLGGHDLLTAGTEGSELAATTIQDDSATVTVAWYGKRYAVTEIARMSTPAGMLSPELFALDAAKSRAQTLVSLIAALGSGFSQSVETSGVNLTFAKFREAVDVLTVNQVKGPYLAVLHDQQWADLGADLGNLPRAAIEDPGVRGAVVAGMGTYKGRLFGVDVFTSPHIPTANAGADRAGIIFGRGAVCWSDKEILPDANPNIVNLGGRAKFEIERKGSFDMNNYITHAYMGVSEGLDAAGVSLITDA